MPARMFNVLFICTSNSARSILAEALLNAMGNIKFHAYSAGSNPSGIVSPLAVNLLKTNGIDTTGLRSTSWNEFSEAGAPELDFVFTLCDDAAGEVCPVWPGHPLTAHWGVPNPTLSHGSDDQKKKAFDDVFLILNRRISLFTSLPFDKLDSLSVQCEIDKIGLI